LRGCESGMNVQRSFLIRGERVLLVIHPQSANRDTQWFFGVEERVWLWSFEPSPGETQNWVHVGASPWWDVGWWSQDEVEVVIGNDILHVGCG
jgi:hypothetical protein